MINFTLDCLDLMSLWSWPNGIHSEDLQGRTVKLMSGDTLNRPSEVWRHAVLAYYIFIEFPPCSFPQSLCLSPFPSCLRMTISFNQSFRVKAITKMLSVVIVGGGIAGFSAAIGLRLSGHAVTLLEKDEEFKEVRSSKIGQCHPAADFSVREGFHASN